MLEHLEIKNYALIENLSVDFSQGFNVITGETGSGKSIILGALGLLMGEKADTSAIRNGADEIVINAVLSVPPEHEILPWLREKGVELEDGALYIKRTVKASGRSMIYVQGQLFMRQDLCHLADSLIDMHGQSEHQSLLHTDKQRKILDSYAKNDALLASCAESYKSLSHLILQKDELGSQLEEARRQEDYLKFALDEIESAKVVDPYEDDALSEKVKILSQFESIYENVTLCTDQLKEAVGLLYNASGFCSKAAKKDSKLSDFTARIESSRIELDDISEGLRDYLSSVDFSQDAINNMQDRLALLQKLKRKYGPTLEKVIAFGQKAKESIELSQNFEDKLAECDKAISLEKKKFDEICSSLTASRKSSASQLEKGICSVLRVLGMPNAQFSIEVSPLEKANSFGSDAVSFVISANPGEPMKEIKAIASGGELSRVMLALKTVLASSDSIQTQVFDEVDSGIGGSVALNLAQCIEDLAQKKQVIAITHLASIASKADTQMVVSKNVVEGRTYTHLKVVSGEDRVHEIARMLSGDESSVSLEHARMMLAD
jgi:DNA repair protein RecN (Recombination protein N)